MNVLARFVHLGLPFPARTFDVHSHFTVLRCVRSSVVSLKTASTGSVIAIPDSKLWVAIHRIVYVQYLSLPEAMSK
jgi:hypothetical protein